MLPNQRTILLMMLLLLASPAKAEKNIRISGALGFGNAGAERDGVVKTEDPLAIGFNIDYSMSSRYTLGIEHNRSWAGTASNVGASGLIAKWYMWTPHAQYLTNPSDEITKNQILQKGYFPYVGASIGFGQSSLPRKTDEGRDVSVAKVYLSGKAGLESPLAGPWGWKSELSWSEGVIGEGSFRMVHLFFGFYYFL